MIDDIAVTMSTPMTMTILADKQGLRFEVRIAEEQLNIAFGTEKVSRTNHGCKT